MKRKPYETPAAEVVELKIAGMLMTSGETTATMDGTFTEETLAPEFTMEDDFSFQGE
jgi:hypothetical protein